jgi:hypothetical protein
MGKKLSVSTRRVMAIPAVMFLPMDNFLRWYPSFMELGTVKWFM